MADRLVDIKFDEAKLRQVRYMLRDIPKAMPKVMSRSINRTSKSAVVEIARQIAGNVKITQAVVKKGIKVQKATYTRWRAWLDLNTKRIPLIKFRARQIKKGVSYQIKKGGGRQRITEPPRPFIQTMPASGHVGVFKRHTERTRRLPIVQLYGPSVAGVFEGASGIATDVQRTTAKRLVKNIDSQVAYILNKRRSA